MSPARGSRQEQEENLTLSQEQRENICITWEKGGEKRTAENNGALFGGGKRKGTRSDGVEKKGRISGTF